MADPVLVHRLRFRGRISECPSLVGEGIDCVRRSVRRVGEQGEVMRIALALPVGIVTSSLVENMLRERTQRKSRFSGEDE
ncbi:MAG: hypothetical protein GF411_08590 [Candidatus Lokiarchaeota archaeon]|nr:hypothetical protein [Candidatus Lokiarchaeota archaeon]